MAPANNLERVLHRKLHINDIAFSSFGTLFAIGITAYLSMRMGYSFLIPSFGATCFIVFVIPDSAFAQPRNVIGGHFLAGLAGLLYMFACGSNWWSQTLAVSTAVAVMQLTRTNHPPAAATTLLLTMRDHVDWSILFTPILIGSIVIFIVAILFNKYIAKRNYPHYWW